MDTKQALDVIMDDELDWSGVDKLDQMISYYPCTKNFEVDKKVFFLPYGNQCPQ